jgi:hypothetical protein
LELFGIGEQPGIDHSATDRLPYLPHGLADGIQKRSARVFHEMPTIGNPFGIRQPSGDRFTIATAPVAGDNRYGRTLGKQARDVSSARSGNSVTGVRRSRSQTIVP